MRENPRGNNKETKSLPSLLSVIADPALAVDSSGLIVAANKLVGKYTGISAKDLVGKKFTDVPFLDEKQKKLLVTNLKKRLNGGGLGAYAVEIKTKKGAAKTLELSGKKIEVEGKKIDIVIFHDVTRRSQLEKKLQHDLSQSELRFNKINDSAFDGIILFDKQQKIRYWNPAAERMFGYKADEVLGKKLQETIIPAYAYRLISKIRRDFMKYPESTNRIIEFAGQKKDGTEFPVEVSISWTSIGKETLFMANVRDVTERRNTERILKQQRDILETVTQNAGLLVMLVTKDYRIFWANEKMKEKEGKDIIGKICHVRLHNRSEVCPACRVKRVFDREVVVTEEDSRFDKNGNPISAQITALPVKDKNGEVFAALEVIVPTTQRKQMESKIKEIEDLYHALFDQTPLGVIVVDPETSKVLQFNENAHRQLGYTREEFSKLSISDFEAAHNKEATLRQLKAALDVGQTEYMTKCNTKNGETRIVIVNQRAIELSSKKLILATCHDVTGINRLHDAVKRSEERFYAIANSVRDPLILVDEQAKVTYWNPAAENTFGYTSKEATGKVIHDLVLPHSMCEDAKKQVKQGIEAFRETGMGYFTIGNVELVGRRKDGTEFPVELSLSPVRLNGQWNAVGIVKDITKRKSADQKLRDAEQRYHALFDQAPLGILVVDPNTLKFVEFNDIAHSQLEFTRVEFEKITLPDIQAEETPRQIRLRLAQLIRDGRGEFETKHRTKNGEIHNVIVSIRAFKSGGKNYLNCIWHDITGAKMVEKALMESETRYRQLVEVAQEGIWAINNDFETAFINPRMAQMLGYAESELKNKSIFDFLEEGIIGGVREFLGKRNSEQMRGPFEYTVPHKDGHRVDVSISLSVITDDQKQRVGILAVVSDITERKRAEKALKQSEALSKAIVANAPIGIATSDSTYRFTSANQAFCNILGYTEEELHELTFREVSDLGEMEASNQKVAALITGEIQFFSMEKRYIKKDGTKIIGKVTVSPLKNQNGRPILFVIELEDITKQKQLENDLRSSEEKFRAISTSAMDAMVLSNEQDQVIYWNPAAEKTFGYSANQAMGKKLVDLVIPPSVHQNHLDLLGELNKTASPRRLLGLPARKRDGSIFPIDLSVVPVKLNGQNRFLSVIRDITEWKAMEEKLRQERDMLESVTASTNMLLSIVDRDYRIIWGNQVAKQTSHGSNIEGRRCYEIFAENPKENCQGCGVKKIFENGESIVRRDYLSPRDGENRWVELISTPIKDKDGKVVSALELAIDINERKRLQNKLAEYSARLEEIVQQRTEQLKKTQAELVKSERLAAIGELAGMVGHDLRNPLTGIKNSAYFMKKKGEQLTPAQAKVMLETIEKCVAYSNKIINDLLDYSREIHLDPKVASPKKILQDSIAMLEIPSKVKVINKIDGKTELSADEDKIKRVFINLLKNAVDAMPGGGTITVKSRHLKGTLEIAFTDTGIGINEEVLPKLFTPLFTTKAQGMGFGLAICKRIIEAHNGTITVHTVKGQGTTFTLTLPAEPKIETGGEKVWINVPESSLSTTMTQ